MQEILEGICAVVGVTGCFVCDGEGQLLASSLTKAFDSSTLSLVGRTLSQTTAGLVTVRRRKVQEMDLVYGDGRVVVKPLREGCLCILCVRGINVPLLNLTANLAAKKLAERMKERPAEAQAEETESISMEPVAAKIAGAYPDVVSHVLELDRSLADEERDSVLMAVGKKTGAMVFDQRYAHIRIPASVTQALELVVLPALTPFSIATASKARLDVLVCPFCRNLTSAVPQCHFLAGFIEGLLNAVPGLDELEVTEVLCRAGGDDTCTFDVTGTET